MASDAKKAAIERLCNICYHQCLWLPATEKHGKLRVTFATTSNFNNEALPVMLFIPPQVSTRWHITSMDHLAQVAGVRVICADRPGFGGSEQVALDLRVDVWLETVPLLLRKLNVQHVSLCCHSAGSVFLLNTLHQHRDIFDPRAPTAILIAPWVGADEAHTISSTVLAKLPVPVMRGQHGLLRVIRKINPSLQWSSAVSSSLFKSAMPADEMTEQDPSIEAERYGCDAETAEEISKVHSEYLWAEGMRGVNDEGLFCVHKSGPGSWGAADDFEKCIREVAEHEKQLSSERKLNIRAFFAESDILVGKNGQKFFENCFEQTGVREVIDFESSMKKGTNHESVIIDHRLGAMIDAFDYVTNRVQAHHSS